jgi:uncharacterized membrane-anchored protein
MRWSAVVIVEALIPLAIAVELAPIVLLAVKIALVACISIQCREIVSHNTIAALMEMEPVLACLDVAVAPMEHTLAA